MQQTAHGRLRYAALALVAILIAAPGVHLFELWLDHAVALWASHAVALGTLAAVAWRWRTTRPRRRGRTAPRPDDRRS